MERIDRIFAAVAARHADAPALVHGDRTLSYGELDEASNRLAHHLRGIGVRRERIVALHVERSFDVLVGILGIIKAGGAYLPLDPGYPTERLEFMLEDSGADVLLTRRELESALRHTGATVALDEDAEDIRRAPDEPPASSGEASDLLYVIYTSGSTGRPKGVLVEHVTVDRLFAASRSFLDFRDDDVWSLFHSCSFGFSVWEMWGALLHGGRLVIVPHEVSVSPTAFFDLVRRERVTVLSQTPSAFRLFVDAESAGVGEIGDSLRAVVFSGEAIDVESLRKWIARHGDDRPQLYNTYALTETGGAVASHRLTHRDLDRGARSVLGRPLPHAAVHILDDALKPVEGEAPGEMFIGGAAVARGYHERPELNTARFLADPVADRDAARCYRTGDLARRLSTGEIEFIGRDDHQVKILGFRIEPGEIESRLVEVSGVVSAVVVAREDRPGDKRLVAYLVGEPGARPDQAALRAHLQRHLPDYMVPSAYEFLDQFPLTPSGKIDRRALPAPDRSRRRLETPFVRPRNEREQRIAEIWREVLDIENVGVRDDFLASGGNSLLAMQVILRVFHAFRIELPLRSIIDIRTIEELAQVLDTIEWTKQRADDYTGGTGREEGAI